MVTSWTNDIECKINDIDVTDCLLRASESGQLSNAIVTGELTFNKRGLDTLVAVANAMSCKVTRKYVVTVDTDTPYSVDQIIFQGYCKTPTDERGRTTVQVQDKLKKLSDSEVNKAYGTEAVPVDLSEVFYDIVVSAGLTATYNVENATIQKSGVTTKGKTFSHENGFVAAKQISDALGWQFYYHPAYDAVYLEPKDYRSTSKPVYSNGDWGGIPRWAKETNQLCNQVTIIPGATDNTATMTFKFTQNVACSTGNVQGIEVPKNAIAIKSVVWTSGGGGGIAAGTTYSMAGKTVDGDILVAADESTAYGWLCNPTRSHLPPYNLWMVNNTYLGLATRNDFYAGDMLTIEYIWSGPVPQTFKDETSIAANGLVAKTITRSDLTASADIAQVAQEYLARFSSPLEQVSIPAVHTPLKLPWLGQLCDIVDAQNGKTRSDMAVVSIELNWPGKKDTIVLGELNALTADYTTGLEERIKQLETSGLSNDYTQGQYTPLGSTEQGGDTTTYTASAAVGTVAADDTTIQAALGYPIAHKVGYAQGRWWVFYCDGTNIVYRTSTDGTTWSAKTTVCASTLGYDFCMEMDGSYVHYIRGSNVGTLYYRRGTLGTDGTITWTAAENSAGAGGSSNSVKALRFDSSGALIYSYRRDNYIYTNRMSSPTTGTWTSDSGYPKAASTTSGSGLQSTITLLSSGKNYTIFGQTDTASKLKGVLWDGSAMGSEADISLTNLGLRYGFTVTVDGDDDLHLAYLGSDNHIYYRHRDPNGTWDAAELDVSGAVTSTTAPFISIDTNGVVYVLWMDATNNLIKYNTVTNGVLGTAATLYSESLGILVTDQGNIMPTYGAAGIGFAYLSDESSAFTVRLLRLTVSSSGGSGSTGGTGTPSSGGRVTVSSGVLNGPDGTAIHLKMVGDSWSYAGFVGARGSSYVPDSTTACPVTCGGASYNSSSQESVATFFYRKAKRLQADGFNGSREGVHQARGLDAIYTAWRANPTQFDNVTLGMARGYEAAGFYWTLCLSGFAEQTASEGGDGYENRQLLTTMTAAGSHLSATGHSTDNILYVGSTSFNNYAAFCAHVGDLLANFPHFVALEMSNEPDNWRQHPVFWDVVPTASSDYSAGGVVYTRMKTWGSSLAAAIRAARTKTWNITNGWTPLAGPPFLAQFCAGWSGSRTYTYQDAAEGIADLNSGCDIAAFHSYHFSPTFCDSQNSGTCDGTVCGQSRFMAAIKAACAAKGMAALNDEWGRYCDSYQVYVSTIADTMTAAGVHWACIVPPSRNAVGSDMLPTGWDSLGV